MRPDPNQNHFGTSGTKRSGERAETTPRHSSRDNLRDIFSLCAFRRSGPPVYAPPPDSSQSLKSKAYAGARSLAIMAQTLTINSSSHISNRASRIVRNLESSQLPASQHDIYLLRFLSLPVTYQMVSYIASYTFAIVDEVLHVVPPSRSSSATKLPDLEDFILHVCRHSNVGTPTLMVSLIYLSRLRKRMPFQALGESL